MMESDCPPSSPHSTSFPLSPSLPCLLHRSGNHLSPRNKSVQVKAANRVGASTNMVRLLRVSSIKRAFTKQIQTSTPPTSILPPLPNSQPSHPSDRLVFLPLVSAPQPNEKTNLLTKLPSEERVSRGNLIRGSSGVLSNIQIIPDESEGFQDGVMTARLMLAVVVVRRIAREGPPVSPRLW